MMKTNLKTLFISLGLSLLLASCTSEPRLQPSGSEAYIPKGNESFDVYVNENKKRIKLALQKIRYKKDRNPFGTQYPIDKVVDMRAPFSTSGNCAENTKGEGIGFLYVHGLSDSPYLLKDIRESISTAYPCAKQRGILLPGHGTIPGDQLVMSRDQWMNITRYGVNSFENKTKQIFMVGFSTGTALSLRYVNEKEADKRVSGLVFLSPALKARTALAPLTVILRYFMDFSEVNNDEDAAKYESFSFNAGAEFYLLTKGLTDKDYPKLNIPVFMASSADDQTVNSQAAREFFCTKAQPGKRAMLWYKSAFPEEKEPLTCDGIEDLSPKSPETKVINYAHTGLTMAPKDRHYGFNGNYKNCLIYGTEGANYQGCKEDNGGSVYGEKNLVKKPDYKWQGKYLRRGTFNPHFETMAVRINDFLDKSISGKW
ncbi:MAG: lysophospholipase [Rhodospirillales bacterium]|nr:lysophospholipase [Rhodospirillales bacterium]